LEAILKNFFRSIFKKKPQAAVDVKTAPLKEEQLKTVNPPADIRMTPPQSLVGSAQSVGKQRDHNEDTLFFFSSVLVDGHSELPFGIYLITDGMGGHLNGELASASAARAFGNYLLTKVYAPYLSQESYIPSESVQELIERAVVEAQNAVVKKAPGGGTTLTCGLAIGDQITIAHVGDSRAYYLYPDGRIKLLTQDHTLVHRLVELGQITEMDALTHPQRNMLYRAVGQSDPYRADISSMQIDRPGYLLICSDGLWGLVPERDILRVVLGNSNPSIACNKLVEMANDAGGPDNISVILVSFLS
jgi:protein phosphatase